MSEKLIRIFVEGINDKRFIDWIISCHYKVQTIPYQEKKNKIINSYINQTKANNKQDYLFLADMDKHTYPCVTSRKNKKVSEYNSLDDKGKIIIVKEEIESWYIAGINNNCPDDIKNIQIPSDTENFTKEEFDDITPSRFNGSCIDFRIEIGKNFDLNLARTRNKSLDRFLRKLDELKCNIK